MITGNKSPNNHGTSQKIDLANRTHLERSDLGTTTNIRNRNVVYQIPGFSSKSPNNRKTSQEIDLPNRTHLERSDLEQRPVWGAEDVVCQIPGLSSWLIPHLRKNPTYEFARSSASLSINGDPSHKQNTHPLGRTGGQQVSYQPNRRFRSASATDFTITARFLSHSIL